MGVTVCDCDAGRTGLPVSECLVDVDILAAEIRRGRAQQVGQNGVDDHLVDAPGAVAPDWRR